MLWNPFRFQKASRMRAVHQLSESADIVLPFPGVTLEDVLELWQQQRRFVPAAEACSLVIEQRLRNEFRLAAGDLRFDGLSALVRSLDPRDRLTGYSRSDDLGLNLQLARLYISQGYGHPPSTCAIRTSSNTFYVYSVRQDGIAVLALVGRNFAGLNRALSTPEEIAADRVRHQQRSASRRAPSGNISDRRRPVPDSGPVHSQMGYARGDSWIQTLTLLAYSLVARDRSRLSPERFAEQVLTPLVRQQMALFEAAGLDCISNTDLPERTGVGLGGTCRILSDATGWTLPDEATLEREIAAGLEAFGHPVSALPFGRTPIERLRDPARAMHILNRFADEAKLLLPTAPETGGTPPRIKGQPLLQLSPVTLAEALVNSNMDAVNRLWGGQWERYEQLANTILNTVCHGHGQLHQFIHEICLASTRADDGREAADHLAIVDLAPFSQLAAQVSPDEADSIRSEIITWFMAGLTSALITGHISKSPPTVFRKTGRRAIDVAKFAIILTEVTEAQARSCLVSALRMVWQNVLIPYGLDRWIGAYAASAPIPPGYVSFDSAISLIGGVHRQLGFLQEENARDPEAAHLLIDTVGVTEPRPVAGTAPPVEDLAALVARHEAPPAPPGPINYFTLVTPDPALPELDLPKLDLPGSPKVPRSAHLTPTA